MQELFTALKESRTSRGLDFCILLVTDVVRSSSRILLENPPPLLDDLPYPETAENILLAEGMVSRKKQLLPVILGLLETG